MWRPKLVKSHAILLMYLFIVLSVHGSLLLTVSLNIICWNNESATYDTWAHKASRALRCVQRVVTPRTGKDLIAQWWSIWYMSGRSGVRSPIWSIIFYGIIYFGIASLQHNQGLQSHHRWWSPANPAGTVAEHPHHYLQYSIVITSGPWTGMPSLASMSSSTAITSGPEVELLGSTRVSPLFPLPIPNTVFSALAWKLIMCQIHWSKPRHSSSNNLSDQMRTSGCKALLTSSPPEVSKGINSSVSKS